MAQGACMTPKLRRCLQAFLQGIRKGTRGERLEFACAESVLRANGNIISMRICRVSVDYLWRICRLSVEYLSSICRLSVDYLSNASMRSTYLFSNSRTLHFQIVKNGHGFGEGSRPRPKLPNRPGSTRPAGRIPVFVKRVSPSHAAAALLCCC